MKITDIKPTVESFGEFEEQLFSIQDTGMIFDILRNKMYSNPIGAICREISCNARDAHREVGKPSTPIEINLPNSLEPFYKIKDFGPGISPDRMANIFIKYTASTKRDDNLQTGGFGLGAKTPFSYSDSFVVITRYNGIKYRYNAFIDPTKVGKMSLAGSELTDEPNGTEIHIPVKSSDNNAFITGTLQACKHWTVLPTVKGGNIDFSFGETIAEGKDWKIVSKNNGNNSNNYNYNSGYSAKEIKLIIDGVEYPLDLNQLKNYSNNNILQYINGDLFLYFGIGELSLAASRESVYLDKQTQAKISTCLDTVLSELKKNVVTKINAIPTLWEAWVYAHDELRPAFANFGFLGPLHWNNIPIKIDGHLSICPNYSDQHRVFVYKKGAWSRKHGNQPDKIERGSQREINFKKNTVLYLNDLGVKEPGVKHVKKLFDDDPTLETVQVVSAAEGTKLDDIVTRHSLKELGAKYLSTITTAKKYKPASQRVLTFRYEKESGAFKQVAYSVYEEDTNTKVLTRLKKDSFMNGRHAIFKDSKNVSREVESKILNILQIKNVSIYGVDEGATDDRVEEDFEDTITLKEYIEDFFKNKSVDFIKIKHCVGIVRSVNTSLHNIVKKHLSKIDQTTTLYTYYKVCDDILQSVEDESKLLTLYEAYFKQVEAKEVKDWLATNQSWDLLKIHAELNSKYPLIAHISSYEYDKAMPSIIEYVKLVESN